MSATAGQDRSDRSLFPIYLVNFIGTLGFSIVIPFLVTLVAKLGGNALVFGIMGATYSSFQLVGAPILGKWSDLHGRRKILLLSQAGTLVSWIVFLTALFLPVTLISEIDSAVLGSFLLTVPLLVLFAARALDGLTGGNVSVANAYLADLTPEADRKKNFGKMAVAGNLGFILGPALAGLLGATAYGEVIPVAAALLISLAATLVIQFYLPESKTCILTRDPEPIGARKVFGQEQKECFSVAGSENIKLRDVLRIPNVRFLLFLNFLIFLGFNFFYTAFPVHATRGLQWSAADLGFFFSFLGLTTVVVQGPILSRVALQCSDALLCILGSAVLAGGFALFTSEQPLYLYGGAALFSLGNGLMWPSFLSLLSKVAGNKYQGSVQGISSSVGSLASIVGLISGGLLYESVGTTTFVISAGLFVVIAALSVLLLSIRTGTVTDTA